MKEIKIKILRVLLAAEETPMPQEALVEAVRNMVWPRPTVAAVDTAVKQMETDREISGNTDKYTGTTWTLTTSGKHLAQKLD